MKLLSFDSGEDGAHVGVLLDERVWTTVWLAHKQAMSKFGMLDLIAMGEAGLRWSARGGGRAGGP